MRPPYLAVAILYLVLLCHRVNERSELKSPEMCEALWKVTPPPELTGAMVPARGPVADLGLELPEALIYERAAGEENFGSKSAI